jgi:hypothetical protein
VAADSNYVTATSAPYPVTLNPGAAAKIVVISGNNQSTTYSNVFPNPMVVQVTDAEGIPLPGVTVNFSGANMYYYMGTSVTTDPTGMATAFYVQATDVGSLTATASVAGIASPATFHLTVTALPATLSWSTPPPILYGTKLWAQQLSASASVPGTFVYAQPAGAVLPAGTQTLTATFTPTDTKHYSGGTVSTTLVVTQAIPVLTWPAPASITAGTALSATQLNATANMPGTFTYSPVSGTVFSTAGTYTLKTTFTPTDTNYAATTAQVQIVVTAAITKTTPTITWATPASIVSGTALSAAQLNATASVPGTFVYTPATGTVLPVGVQTLSALFTPTDTVHYNGATATVTISVTGVPLVAPVVTWKAPAAITYGVAVGPVQLSATANVPGTFVYSPTAGTILQPGTQTLSVTFTPTDTTKYSVQKATQTIIVNPIKATLTWNTPPAMKHGTALWAQQLSAFASVPGTFTYTPPAGTILPVGTQTLSATFVPTDTVHYIGGTITTTVAVQ